MNSTLLKVASILGQIVAIGAMFQDKLSGKWALIGVSAIAALHAVASVIKDYADDGQINNSAK